MKRFLLVVGAFLALPALVGIVDAWCHTLLGAQATGIDWTGGRALVAYIFGALSIALFVIGPNTGRPPRIDGYQPRRGSNPPPTYERPPAPPNPPRSAAPHIPQATPERRD